MDPSNKMRLVQTPCHKKPAAVASGDQWRPVATSGDQWRPVATVVCQRVVIHYHHKPQRPNIFISSSSHLHLKGHQPSSLEHRSNDTIWIHLVQSDGILLDPISPYSMTLHPIGELIGCWIHHRIPGCLCRPKLDADLTPWHTVSPV